MSASQETCWYLEELSIQNGEWGSIYYGYKFSYEQALAKLRHHRRNAARANAKHRNKYRLVCQITQRFP